MNMIENAMLNNGIIGPGQMFSMEMGDTDLAERMISSVGGIYQGNMRTANMGITTGRNWRQL